MRRDFLTRDRTLEQIRSALYESGNVVRDYVLVEPGENKAETLRTELKTIRDDMGDGAKSLFPFIAHRGERAISTTCH